MKSLSIRARLTAVITTLTAVLAVLSVLGGLALLRGNVRDRVIETRLDALPELVEDRFLEGATGSFFVLDDDPAVFTMPGFDQQSMQLIQQTVSLLQRAEVLDELTEQTGVASDMSIFFGGGKVGIISLDDGGAASPNGRVGPLSEASEPVLLLDDLLELTFISLYREDRQIDRELRLIVEESTVNGTNFAVVADVSSEYAALDDVARSLWLAALALTVLALGGTWLVTTRALRPVAAITERVADITSRSLDDRVPEPAQRDEIGVLASTMNGMLDRIESGDLRRRQFVSDASHELRTPVAVLRSEAEVAQKAPDSTSVESLAAVMLSESHRLGGMVEDLLALARSDELDAGSDGAGGASSTADLDEIVLLDADRSRRVQIDRSAVSAGRVVGDSATLRRVVSHLLDNAARHANTLVRVGVQTITEPNAAPTVRLWIEDDGAGIAEADRRRVFDRFVRLDEARTRDGGGAGLGLSFVKTSVERMGGQVVLTESALGGARFDLILPAG